MECTSWSVLGSYLLSTQCPVLCEWAQCLFCYRAFRNADVEDVDRICCLRLEHQWLQHLPCQAPGQGKMGKGWMVILGGAGLTHSCSHAVYSRIIHSAPVQGAGEEFFEPLSLLRMCPSGWHFCWWREECMSKVKQRLKKSTEKNRVFIFMVNLEKSGNRWLKK